MQKFVVQEHHAKKLHWDFRLEIDGVLKSWAVPKGPSMNPRDKRLAVQVPDHDLKHAEFEGVIPEGSYGAGPVLIWDSGSYEMLEPHDPEAGLQRGRLTFRLRGHLLKGEFSLIRMRGWGVKNWLLIKGRDSLAQTGWKAPVLLTPTRERNLEVRAPHCDLIEG